MHSFTWYGWTGRLGFYETRRRELQIVSESVYMLINIFNLWCTSSGGGDGHNQSWGLEILLAFIRGLTSNKVVSLTVKGDIDIGVERPEVGVGD